MCDIITIIPSPCYDLYVNSFRDPERNQRMQQRLQSVGVSAKIYHFQEDDPRAFEVQKYSKHAHGQSNYGNCYSMLKIIEDFYNESDKEYCVILENDVFIKKSFAYDLPKMCQKLTQLGLDVLLIGSLLTVTPDQMGFYKIFTDSDQVGYYQFPDDLWGSHGFIINKKHAKYLIDLLTFEFVGQLEGVGGDWIYTKFGKRALMWPPLVVEEGFIKADCPAQLHFHMACRHFQHNANYTN